MVAVELSCITFQTLIYWSLSIHLNFKKQTLLLFLAYICNKTIKEKFLTHKFFPSLSFNCQLLSLKIPYFLHVNVILSVNLSWIFFYNFFYDLLSCKKNLLKRIHVVNKRNWWSQRSLRQLFALKRDRVNGKVLIRNAIISLTLYEILKFKYPEEFFTPSKCLLPSTVYTQQSAKRRELN